MKPYLTIIILFFGLFLWADEYRFSGDSSYSIMREGAEETRIEGNVEILSSERSIKADTIRIVGRKDKYFQGEGHVIVEDFERNMLLRANEFRFDEADSLLQLNGQAVLEDRDNEILVKCDRLEYRQDEEVALMQLNVRIFKDDIICRSEYAIYRRSEELLELSGTPLVIKGDDRYEADRIVVNLKTDEITMFGEISGEMKTGDQDE
ncbi:MAG: hypothetical protein PF447_04640 [Spirochaetaceae bacterium]|jgi:lipopolysaccharide export system protein LptA|nr:hypothetical protein [Spirochaetaceae bacterium]